MIFPLSTECRIDFNSTKREAVRYRMHPLLSAFPSMQFYDGELQDAKHKTNALWT